MVVTYFNFLIILFCIPLSLYPVTPSELRQLGEDKSAFTEHMKLYKTIAKKGAQAVKEWETRADQLIGRIEKIDQAQADKLDNDIVQPLIQKVEVALKEQQVQEQELRKKGIIESKPEATPLTTKEIIKVKSPKSLAEVPAAQGPLKVKVQEKPAVKTKKPKSPQEKAGKVTQIPPAEPSIIERPQKDIPGPQETPPPKEVPIQIRKGEQQGPMKKEEADQPQFELTGIEKQAAMPAEGPAVGVSKAPAPKQPFIPISKKKKEEKKKPTISPVQPTPKPVVVEQQPASRIVPIEFKQEIIEIPATTLELSPEEHEIIMVEKETVLKRQPEEQEEPKKVISEPVTIPVKESTLTIEEPVTIVTEPQKPITIPEKVSELPIEKPVIITTEKQKKEKAIVPYVGPTTTTVTTVETKSEEKPLPKETEKKKEPEPVKEEKVIEQPKEVEKEAAVDEQLNQMLERVKTIKDKKVSMVYSATQKLKDIEEIRTDFEKGGPWSEQAQQQINNEINEVIKEIATTVFTTAKENLAQLQALLKEGNSKF
jgi:hypothetical protein